MATLDRVTEWLLSMSTNLLSLSNDIFYHIEKLVPNTNDDEYQQEESADHLRAFDITPDNHPSYRQGSTGGRV